MFHTAKKPKPSPYHLPARTCIIWSGPQFPLCSRLQLLTPSLPNSSVSPLFHVAHSGLFAVPSSGPLKCCFSSPVCSFSRDLWANSLPPSLLQMWHVTLTALFKMLPCPSPVRAPSSPNPAFILSFYNTYISLMYYIILLFFILLFFILIINFLSLLEIEQHIYFLSLPSGTLVSFTDTSQAVRIL